MASSAPHAIGSSGGQAVISEQKGDHTFEKVVLVHPSAKASVEIYLHGATVTSWKILGNEMLYLSPKAVYAPGKAIRGGVPVVFPQFGGKSVVAGDTPLPQHGFARNSVWSLGETKVVQASGDISTEFFLQDSEATRAAWPNRFKLTLTVLLKPTSLSMQLRVENRNEDGKPFSFTSLLHTYLRVDSIARTSVRGLQGKKFIDQLDKHSLKEQRTEAVTFPGEVDAIYLDANTARVSDGGNCELLLKTTGFKDFVVWNPHVAKTATMADMPAEAWKEFVCVEAGAVNAPVNLEAGASWEAAQGISISMTQDTQQQVAETLQAQQKL